MDLHNARTTGASSAANVSSARPARTPVKEPLPFTGDEVTVPDGVRVSRTPCKTLQRTADDRRQDRRNHGAASLRCSSAGEVRRPFGSQERRRRGHPSITAPKTERTREDRIHRAATERHCTGAHSLRCSDSRTCAPSFDRVRGVLPLDLFTCLAPLSGHFAIGSYRTLKSCQHSMTLTVSPPRAVSLYLTFMSRP
jgi:hypothetical protein